MDVIGSLWNFANHTEFRIARSNLIEIWRCRLLACYLITCLLSVVFLGPVWLQKVSRLLLVSGLKRLVPICLVPCIRGTKGH